MNKLHELHHYVSATIMRSEVYGINEFSIPKIAEKLRELNDEPLKWFATSVSLPLDANGHLDREKKYPEHLYREINRYLSERLS